MPYRTSGGIGYGLYVGSAQYSVYGQVDQIILGNTYFSYVGHSYEPGTGRLTGTRVSREVAPATFDLDATYTYDDAGNPTSVVDDPTSRAGDAQCFAYDGLRRLTQAWTPTSANCAAAPSTAGLGGAAPYWFTDTFDPVGNRTTRVAHQAAGSTTHAYKPPVPGAPTSSTFGYDAAGNTTTRTITTDPAQTLTWDAEGELAAVASAGGPTDSYVYTADGDRLIRRQAGATTVYLPGGQELSRNPAGQVKATRYYTFAGQTVAVRTGPGNANVTNLVADHHGTAQLAIHATTSAVTRKYTDPYGNPRGTAPTTWTGDHGFLDQPTDTTGLTQIGARYYDPITARFISVDPLMDLADPQQWHGYSYANNNPVTYSDPTGLRPMAHDGGATGTPRRTTAAAASSAPPASVAPPVRINLWRLYTSYVSGSTRAIKDAAVGVVQSSPVYQVYSSVLYARTNLGADWHYLTQAEGSYADKLGAQWSASWTSTRDAITTPWRQRDIYAIVNQLGYAEGTAATLAAGGAGLRASAARLGTRSASAARTGAPTVVFSRSRAPGIAQNFDDAVASGAPTRLNRVGGALRDANRRAALRGQTPAPAGLSLDEFPFACSAQGGCGSFVRAVPVGEQRYQGGVLSRFFQDRGIGVGDPFNVTFGP